MFLNTWGGLKLLGRIWCDDNGLLRFDSAMQMAGVMARPVAMRVETLILGQLIRGYLPWLRNGMTVTLRSSIKASEANSDEALSPMKLGVSPAKHSAISCGSMLHL